MAKKSKNEKGLEYYKKMFLEYARRCEADEEMRLASEYEIKVNLLNIRDYSAYLQGARRMMCYWSEYEPLIDNKAFKDAIVKLITSELRYMDMFLTGSYEMRFKNHQYDKKGKLVKVEAYFAEKVTIYKEV